MSWVALVDMKQDADNSVRGKIRQVLTLVEQVVSDTENVRSG